MKIFIALGSQKYQLNRLLKEMDDILSLDSSHDWDVFAQIGASSYRPKRYAYTRYLSNEEYVSQISNADLLIVHGGAGTIMKALAKGKRIIVYPRKKCFHEHIDDHQNQIARELQKQGYVLVCDGGNLLELIHESMVWDFKTHCFGESRIPEILRNYFQEYCLQ